MKQDRLREHVLAKTAENRNCETTEATNLVSSHLLNGSEHIRPQLPSNRNQKRDLTELGSHYGVRSNTKIQNNPESSPPKKLPPHLWLWLMREITGQIASLDLSQGISDGRGVDGDSPGKTMFQPVLPCEHTTNVKCD